MATKSVTATFASVPAAVEAARSLHQFGVGEGELRLEECGLYAQVDDAYFKLVEASLQHSGALVIQVRQNSPDSEDWMGHHSGATTSAGVPAGQGDSEAGSS